MYLRVYPSSFRLLILGILCAILAGCGGGKSNIIGLGETVLPLSSESGATTHRIFIATTRARSEDPTEFFSGERSTQMTLGQIDVAIPQSHETGQIETPPSRTPDPRKHFVVGKPQLYEGTTTFRERLNGSLQERGIGSKDILVFVHGYNVNFSAAVLRVAQFVHDTGYQGVPVLFSWASSGKRLDYVYDINSALQARDHLEELGVIISGANVEHFDVVAHSMGNLVTLEAMGQLQKRTDLDSTGRLRRVVLAAPDIDFDVFKAQLRNFEGATDVFYVLVSGDDKALTWSRRIAGGVSRVGAADPTSLAELGVNVIDVSQINDESNVNHSKFADSPAIVQLIGRGMQEGNTLSAQSGINPAEAIVGDIYRGLTVIPSTILGGQQSVILTVAN